MANNPFTTTTTTATATPSLGATDLAGIMGAGFVIAFGGHMYETRPKARRSLLALLRKLVTFRSGASSDL